MPGNNLASMIEMLTALSGIQTKRRELDLQSQQLEQQKSQFAQQMGFNEKSEEFKKVSYFVQKIADSSMNSRDALGGLAKTLGLNDQLTQGLLTYGTHADMGLEALKTHAANQGYAQASAQNQQYMNQGAAFGATTGQTPFDAIGAASNIGNAPQAQAIATQVAMSPYQRGQQGIAQEQNRIAQQNANISQQQANQQGTSIGNQFELGKGQIGADYYRTNATLIQGAAEVSAKLATAKRFGGLNPTDIIQGIGGMREILTQVDKSTDKSTRTMLLSSYNKLAETIDPRLAWNGEGKAPDPTAILNKFNNPFSNNFNQPSIGGGQPPQYTPPQSAVAPFMPTPGGQQLTPPSNPYANFFNRP